MILKQLKLIITTIISLFFTIKIARADSPLTSTNIANFYEDLEVMKEAKNNKKVEGELLRFLLSDVSLDKKAAIINGLGWNFEGQNNAYLFLKGLAKTQRKTVEMLTLNDLTPSNKFVIGYLLAMDDYLYLSPLKGNFNESLKNITPIDFLSQAAFALPYDFTAHFIKSLVEAQKNMDSSWCNVYLLPQSVLNQFPEKQRNLRPSAVNNVMDYINLYREYCNSKSSY